jgi:hypothetical protein
VASRRVLRRSKLCSTIDIPLIKSTDNANTENGGTAETLKG